MRESHFEELCGLWQNAVSWAIYIVKCCWFVVFYLVSTVHREMKWKDFGTFHRAKSQRHNKTYRYHWEMCCTQTSRVDDVEQDAGDLEWKKADRMCCIWYIYYVLSHKDVEKHKRYTVIHRHK